MGSIIYIAESEAVKKYCPFSMSGNTGRCEGSSCMSWHFKQLYKVVPMQSAGSPRIEYLGDSDTDGYCKPIEKNGD